MASSEAAGDVRPWTHCGLGIFHENTQDVIKHQEDTRVPSSNMQNTLFFPKLPNILRQVSFLPLCKQHFGKSTDFS